MIKSDVIILVVHRKFSRSYPERLAVYQPYKNRRQKILTAGKYYRIRLQLCAYATFSATTAETFPSVQVFWVIHVWTDFADFESVDTLG